jgi:hypothetical protein
MIKVDLLLVLLIAPPPRQLIMPGEIEDSWRRLPIFQVQGTKFEACSMTMAPSLAPTLRLPVIVIIVM